MLKILIVYLIELHLMSMINIYFTANFLRGIVKVLALFPLQIIEIAKHTKNYQVLRNSLQIQIKFFSLI